jgi:hypothetical protein
MRLVVRSWGLAVLITVAAGCSSVDDPRDGSFGGVYISAFETSSFRPCGSADSWWLTDASGALFNQLPSANSPPFLRVAFVRVEGQRSGRGQYGHLGAYPFELTVSAVLEVAADTTGKCR